MAYMDKNGKQFRRPKLWASPDSNSVSINIGQNENQSPVLSSSRPFSHSEALASSRTVVHGSLEFAVNSQISQHPWTSSAIMDGPEGTDWTLQSSMQRAAHYFTIGDAAAAQRELRVIAAHGGPSAAAALRAFSGNLRVAAAAGDMKRAETTATASLGDQLRIIRIQSRAQ
jgi:hypothetical protein